MKDTRTEYRKEWRKKHPKKYAMNQLNFWKKRVKELEQEERELFGSDKSSDDEDVQQLKKDTSDKASIRIITQRGMNHENII